jgi:3-phenylpropionate/cinnamic acid dioxygenase small subunit
MQRTLEHLCDRMEIIDLLHRYAISLDSRDWQRLATCFTVDAVALYGPVLGRQDGFAAIEKLCRTALEPLDSSQHLIGSHALEIDGDRARARCYLHAQHTKAGTAGGDNFTIGGTYVDELVRTDAGWRIRQRELIILWQEGNPRVLGQTP